MGKNLSTFAIAKMLRVDPGSVANWIDQNLLKAYRTPGGHRRVLTEDLVKFLRNHKMPIPAEMDHFPPQVLIIDDDPSVTQLIAKAIKTAFPSVDITEVNDGFRAGALAATLRPDVVIFDLRMPGMDGLEVCKFIKSHEHTRHAHVLAMTGHSSPESEKAILDCGATACLTKPLDMEALLKELRLNL